MADVRLLTAAISALVVSAIAYSPADVARLDALAVGETTSMSVPSGDGCNVCTCSVKKVSETEIEWSSDCMCTLRSCPADLRREPYK